MSETELPPHESPPLTESQTRLLDGLKRASELSETFSFKMEHAIDPTIKVHDKVGVLTGQESVASYLSDEREVVDETRILDEILAPEAKGLLAKTAKEIFEEIKEPRRVEDFRDGIAAKFEEGKYFFVHMPTEIDDVTYRLSIRQGKNGTTIREEAFLIGHEIYMPGSRT